ncbi:hypothetical protein GKZ68_01350 [Hymenobacter sp. BRD128]|uniref:hypothetical protein n=1 Tax=Hymenobacter sp. BRD128 TaxID=2675878 RepID=UPI001566B259|nr:hypothetical protein [Hymenobacter sp. BRD128]QKG55401.1 hypothetical protein GKZ68_01350 [Hymenobacter sp. BRD128]
MRYYLLAALGLSATSCLSVGPDVCNNTLLTPITAVSGPKTIAINQPAVYSLSYLPAGGCGTLANLSEQSSGNTRAIGVNINYASCSCTTTAVPAQTTYTFQPTQAGTYYLKFLGNNAYITDTLVVQ